ncbi:MAG TPA: toll/interleukin-1 receptor domain-containing protein [Ktedonobacterales bacterium]
MEKPQGKPRIPLGMRGQKGILMAGVFISYRRADSGPICGRITESLRAVFGSNTVFRDVTDIPGGIDFRRSIGAALDHCNVVVALIGPTWINATDQAGRPRLENPEDPVRVEIESALLRGMRIIPVTVLGGRMPKAEALPDSVLRQLHYLNVIEIHDDPLYRTDIDRLIQEIANFVPLLPTDQSRLQQQANAAYVQAQRIGKQAAPVVKTIATGVAIFQIVIALMLAAFGIGAVAIAYGVAGALSQSFAAYPAAGSSADLANTFLLIFQIVGIGFFLIGLLWAGVVLVALMRAYRRRAA